MIKNASNELSPLYDLSGLSLVDNDHDRVIITDVDTLYKEINDVTKFRQALSKLIVENLTGKIKTGDVVLLADENFSRKIYCLITVACGQLVPYILYDVNYDNGAEWIASFSKGDVEMLSEYPMFKDPSELIFFLTNLGKVFGENATTDNRSLIQPVKTFLDKGFWAAFTDGNYDKPDDIANKLGLKKVGVSDAILPDLALSMTPVPIYEKDGKHIAFYDYNLYGDYELVKAAFCEIAKSNDSTNHLLYAGAFGWISKVNTGMLMTRLTDFENDVKLLSKSKPVEKTEAEVTKEIIKSQEKTSVVEEDFFAKAEEMIESAKKQDKTKRKKKREESFEIQSEVSQQEKDLAISETIMKPNVNITIPKRITKQKISELTKDAEKVLNAPNNSYPSDWDYVYSIEETSRLYNDTVGQEYDEATGKFYANEGQTRGMTPHEWCAYFYAHPELNHLVDAVIGHIGGLYISEAELKESGHLLYNPKKLKLDYVHEYVIGNVYRIIEEFEAVKDAVVQVYGQAFYDRQVEVLLSKRPQVKSITAAEEKNVPFIHPLDEVIIDYKINSAAGVTFYNNQNAVLMRAEGKRLEAEISAKTIISQDYEQLMEEFGSKLQSLSITVFFMEWLGDQVGKLAAYGLPDITMVNSLYFQGMSYPMFANGMAERGLIIVPKDKKPVDIVTYSDYYEAKDSAKRLVNDLFQDFLLNEITDPDRKKIEYEWNKRYNGYVTVGSGVDGVWKLPIFIRHSKYFKNRTSRRKLKLNDKQIAGIKFATIDNSSIMAHEVGYGKCEWIENDIFTPDGTKKMKDIEIGDYVIGSNGKPNMVIGTFPQGEKEMFRVSFNDNSSVIVCGEHLWQVQSMRQRSQEKYKKNSFVKTTKEILEAGLTYERTPGHIQNRWSIPMTKPVEFESQNVFIEPYLLGLLLGDGCISVKDGIGFSNVDKELVDAVSDTIPNGLSLKKKKTSDIDYGISRLSRLGSDQSNPLLIYLRNYGLQGKKSNNKFIPNEYKFNSVEVRLAVLQGLLDTDGSAATHQIEYTTVSKQLADDVVFLTQSLGGTAKVKEKNTTYTYKGEKKNGQLAYRLDIKLPGDIQPFRLQRKLNKYIPKTKYQPARFITGIEFVGNLEGKCIKVEAQDSLYLTENFIVTHNTLVAIGYMSHCFETGQASNFLVTIPKTLYVNRKWREEIYGTYDAAKDRYIIGAVPIYNIIELGNFSTSSIWSGGESKYKSYSEDDQNKINELFQLFTEIGGQQSGKRASKSQGTAVVPKNPYNFRLAVSGSNYAWSKLINKVLPGIDKHLFNRSITRGFEEHNAVLKLLSSSNLGTSTKDKVKNLVLLGESIIELRWFYQRHLPLFGPDVDFKGFAPYDERTRKEWEKFKDSELPNKYEKDKEGKVIYVEVDYVDKDGNKLKKDVPKLRPLKVLYEEYLLSVLEELHAWIESIIQKMSDFAIYEYGEWKFNSGSHNIILSTKEALQNLGFSSNYLNGIIDVIKEITTYKSEENFDISRAYVVKVVDDKGEQQFIKRDPQKVLQKQLQEMVDNISKNMTEEGPRGKFFLENLKIDGFILDEAHIAKKIFTNVKTDANVRIDTEKGGSIMIKTTSHDIRGGKAPETALAVFGICQYIRSIGNNKPVMLLTATPFSNQPTEIFSMLSLVGIRQLREYGISNIKNFFDLFLKETLKYDFNHSGEFIKRITVEDFRNKELLINLIWSVMDIRRESSMDKSLREKRYLGDKPIRIVFPKLVSDSSLTQVAVDEEEEDFGLSECEQLGKVSTIAIVNRINTNTCSIVDQNDTQKKMLSDIEKVVHGTVNPKTNLEYTFDDVCPNAAIYNEIEKEKGKSTKTEEEEERDTAVVALRNILNTNIKSIPNGLNVADYGIAHSGMPNMKYGELVFVEKDSDGNWRIYKKVRTKSRTGAFDSLEMVTDEATITETLKTLSKKTDYGVTFKALGMSRAIALSPYLFRCNDLPEPTPENIIKYSPKIEFLVKALKSVKDYHINEIPKRIKDRQDELAKINAKPKKDQDDLDMISQIEKELPQLEAAKEVSGQVVYMNMIRFNYYSRTEKGKAVAQQMNLAKLIREYLINKGWFTAEEVQIVSSETGDSDKEQYIRDFQEGKIKVLFGTPAIKEGVDLQNKASTMYIMTPDWNPTDMRQVEGRIHRRDNENLFVRIVYVLLDQSVEVFIYAKLEEKARRLQQIMKERETIEELEEMSLNPNETKVALASDPDKRADIITKLCQAVLMDQRNKINKSREELNRVASSIDVVYNNIEIIKNQYLIPYHELVPEIDKRYYDYQMKSIADQFINAKSTFINRFAHDYYGNVGSYGKVENDKTLSVALSIMDTTPSMDAMLYWITTVDNSVTQDIINGLEVGIENRDTILSSDEKNYISYDVINELLPMKHSIDSKSSSFVNDYLIGSYTPYYAVRLFKLPTVIYAYSDEMRARLLAVIKEIKAAQVKGSVSRYDIREKFENLAVLLTEDLRDYATNSHLVRPENYRPYLEAQTSRRLSRVMLTSDEFDAKELMGKINDILYVYEELNNSLRTFTSASVNTKRDILSGLNKTPVKAEILVKLELAVEDKDIQRDIMQEMEALFKPVLKIKSVLREIEYSFLKARGLKIDDLPKLVADYNDQYDVITKKMEALEASRQKLIERFRKTSEQRRLVTIDQIVAKFAETNTYLNNKLQEQN